MRRMGSEYTSASKHRMTGLHGVRSKDLKLESRKQRRRGSASASSTAAPLSQPHPQEEPQSQLPSQSLSSFMAPSQSSAPTVRVPVPRRLDLAPPRSSESPRSKPLDALPACEHICDSNLQHAHRFGLASVIPNGDQTRVDNERQEEAVGVPLTFLAGPCGTLGLTTQPGDQTPLLPSFQPRESGHGEDDRSQFCDRLAQDSDDTIPEPHDSSPSSLRRGHALLHSPFRPPRPVQSRTTPLNIRAHFHTSSGSRTSPQVLSPDRASVPYRDVSPNGDDHDHSERTRSSARTEDGLNILKRFSEAHLPPYSGQVHVHALHTGGDDFVTSQELAHRARAAVRGAFEPFASLTSHVRMQTYTTPRVPDLEEQRSRTMPDARLDLCSQESGDVNACEDEPCLGPASFAPRVSCQCAWDPVPSSFQPELEDILVPVSPVSSPRHDANSEPAALDQPAEAQSQYKARNDVVGYTRCWQQTLTQKMATGCVRLLVGKRCI